MCAYNEDEEAKEGCCCNWLQGSMRSKRLKIGGCGGGDKITETRRKKKMEKEMQPWFLYPETQRTLTSPPTSHLLSLSPLNLPSTQLPSASYHGNRRGAENEGEMRREREVCRLEAKSTEEQRVSAEEGSRFVAPAIAWLRCLQELDASLMQEARRVH